MIIIGFLIIARFFIIVFVGIMLGIIVITIVRRQNLQQIETRAFLLGCFDRPHEGVDHPRDRLRLARCDLAAGERRACLGTAFRSRDDCAIQLEKSCTEPCTSAIAVLVDGS